MPSEAFGDENENKDFERATLLLIFATVHVIFLIPTISHPHTITEYCVHCTS
jgi:hypothetical protein